MSSAWNKFTLLMWKNWLLQWRHPIQTIVEILAPVLFSLLLVLFRRLIDPEHYPDTNIYRPFDPSQPPFVEHVQQAKLNATLTRLHRLDVNETLRLMNKYGTGKNFSLAYSPTSVPIDMAMQTVGKILKMGVYGLATADEMEKNLTGSEISFVTVLAGIEFPDEYKTFNELPQHIEYSLRFPSESRFAPLKGPLEEPRSSDWRTFQIFPRVVLPGPRLPQDNDGGYPTGYYNEGFLTLQYWISTAIIEYWRRGHSPKIPKIQMQRFPHPGYIWDPVLFNLESFVSIIVMLSFVYTCISSVKVITMEKEKQLKEAMKIMGLPCWLHWVAWFIKLLCFSIISIILTIFFITVRWYSDSEVSVFTYTTRPILFLLLFCFLLATITFCFMVSTFFSKANTAATVAGLLWFMTYAPYLFCRENYDFLSFTSKICICFAHNSAMAFGFQFLIRREASGEGGSMSNIWVRIQDDDPFTLGHVLVMLVCDAILYWLIAIYVEQIFPGDWGVPQPWYYPVTKSYWMGNNNEVGPEDNSNDIETIPKNMYEREPTNLNVGIQIRNLHKEFGNGVKRKTAVNKMNLNMYQGQITALLGHNGAGKTTTMCMLTGMLPPTKGTAIVNGYDIRTDIDGVRSSLGLCPQHNILFDDLTVKEHLYFFSKLKGLKNNDIKLEIDRYIKLLDLEPKRNVLSSKLSGGMQRKLSVGVALCGGSKVVLFDEPTAGMDPSARRALWDLLQKEKKGRTILLSTHFMDEADLLGDRIAIMAGGELQCCGSSFFLKKRYGTGYNLIMEKDPNCHIRKITALLQKYIPTLSVQSDIGSELSYLLAEEMADKFEPMLHELESNSQLLGVNSYGISLTTLEEVFMKVGADQDAEHSSKTGSTKSANTEQTNVEVFGTPFVDTTRVYLQGILLSLNQFQAMFLKKILATKRSWILMLVQICITVTFLVLAIVVVHSWNLNKDLRSLKITLDSYFNSYTILSAQNGPNQQFADSYKQMIGPEQSRLLDINDNDFSDYILSEADKRLQTVRKKFIVGADFHDDGITAWFSNQPYHAAPLALNLVHNALLRFYTNSTYSINVYNKPLPFQITTKMNDLQLVTGMGFQVAFNVGFSMAFVSAFYILFNIRERACKAKHLQFVSGVKVLTFWSAAYLWDMITFIVTAILLVITLACFQEDGYKTPEQLGRVLFILILFGASMIPMMYVASFLFEVPSTGFTRMSLINIFTGVAVFVVTEVMINFNLDFGFKLEWIFLLVPHFCLSSGLRAVYTIASTSIICNKVCEKTPFPTEFCLSQLCAETGKCCMDDINEDYYAWERPGIGRQIFFMITVGITLILILLIVEWNLIGMLIYKLENMRKPPEVQEEELDDDVKEERNKIQGASKEEISQYNLVLRDLTKYYSNKLVAVNKLNIGVRRFECFGLLGINGAGKTTTFKMLTGDVKMSSGNAYVKGLSLKTQMQNVQKIIGYCPQFDALIDDLTGRETLTMFCLLRGISHNESKLVAESLAHELDFSKHIDKQVKQYSGGNKRKLSTAIALVADPSVIYLDEPTTGMDPATKRHLWNVVCAIRNSGRCVVLTSHSMEECEALCTRLAIMVNGTFRCLGSVQHLKNKFSSGYTLVIKLKKSEQDADVQAAEIDEVKALIQKKFEDSTLREAHEGLLTFYIATSSLPWSAMFGVMEKAKKSIPQIEDYSLGQSSLEQVFLTFTKKQRESE